MIVHQRNRKRPVFGAYNQAYSSVRLGHDPMHLLVFDDEAAASIQVLYWVAGRQDILAGRSENAQGRLIVLCLHCGKESVRRFFGGGKGPLSWLLGKRWRIRTSQGKCE